MDLLISLTHMSCTNISFTKNRHAKINELVLLQTNIALKKLVSLKPKISRTKINN